MTRNELAHLESRLEYLQRELEEVSAERDALQKTCNLLQSSKDVLESEVEFLAAWRQRELERLRFEAMNDAIKRGLAQQGLETTIDEG